MKMFLPKSKSSVATEAATKTVLLKRCSSKFHKIHRKRPAPDSIFNNVAVPATLLKKRL